MTQVFPAKERNRRYLVEFFNYDHWARDDTYHTYLFARLSVATWNSIGHDARIIDTSEPDGDPPLIYTDKN